MNSINISRKWLILLIIVFVLVVCVAIVFVVSLNKEKTVGKIDEVTDGVTDITSDNTPKYTVTFYANNGTVLKIDSVSENSSAVPPATPSMTHGTVFKSWDTDFSNVTKDLEIHPVCEEIKDKPNVLVVQSRYSKKDGVVVVPIQLCGNVCVSGLDIIVRYDKELLNLKAVTEDKGVIFNDASPGVIKLNYVSTQNTVADVDICNLQFYVNAMEGEIPITIEIAGIYAFEDQEQTDTLFIPESTVIDGKIFVIN